MPDRFSLRLLGCERGNAALVSAATLPLLLTLSALAYDAVRLAAWDSRLQALADRGAIAGARALAGREPVRAAVEQGLADRRIRLAGPALVEPAPAAGPAAVRVVITSQHPLPFLGTLLTEPPTLRAEATATYLRRPIGDRRDPVRLIG